MNPQRDRLSEALRELASASPEASSELHARLGESFAQHHAQRRLRQRTAVVVALAACVAIFLVALRISKRNGTANVIDPSPTTAQAPSPERKKVAPEAPKVARPSVARASGKSGLHARSEPKPRSRGVESAPATVAAADFIALPTFDPAIPVGESHMVRMNLAGSALQLMGYPVEGPLLDRHILTDVLVGQDGMPYAVRLVQTRNGY